MEARQIIIRPIITERSFDMQDFNRYTFEVAKTASKIEIAKAIEEIFNVHGHQGEHCQREVQAQAPALCAGSHAYLEEGHRHARRG